MAVDRLADGSPEREGPVFRFRCTACAYGASRRAAPERCPMCGGSTWEYEAWRPFSTLLSDLAPTENTPTAIH
jgi:rubrerythrin